MTLVLMKMPSGRRAACAAMTEMLGVEDDRVAVELAVQIDAARDISGGRIGIVDENCRRVLTAVGRGRRCELVDAACDRHVDDEGVAGDARRAARRDRETDLGVDEGGPEGRHAKLNAGRVIDLRGGRGKTDRLVPARLAVAPTAMEPIVALPVFPVPPLSVAPPSVKAPLSEVASV